MAGKGGAIPGNGRKTKAEELGVALMLASAINDDQWKELIKKCYNEAKQGSYPHLRLLMEYRFGKPIQPIKGEVDATIIWHEEKTK